METIEALVKQAKEINRNRIIELNERDLKDNGIEQDWWRYSTSHNAASNGLRHASE